MRVLAIDVGGTNVKVLSSGQSRMPRAKARRESEPASAA